MLEKIVLMSVPAYFVASYAGMMVGCWALFPRAGLPNWAALVPGYNLFLLVRLAGLNRWWSLLFLVPAANMILWFHVCDQLALKSDRGIGTSLGLMCLGFAFFPVLGFGTEAPWGRRSSSRRDDEGDEDEDERPGRSRDRHDDEEEDESRPRRRKRRPLPMPGLDARATALLAGVLVALVVVVGGIWYAVRTIRRSPFRPHLASYTPPPAGEAPPGTKVRKMVVVDVVDNDIDGVQFDLPDDLRAGSPEEATTVAQLRWDKRQVGSYSGAGGAYQWFCSVTVIDLKTRGRIATREFAGSPPPQSFEGQSFESRAGNKPHAAVVDYLKGLRRD